MKPSNWNKMTKKQKEEHAIALFNDMRGRYIIGQALAIASETMKKVKYPETSNIEDMEALGEVIFQLGYFVTKEKKS
jgi:hypothetical protein